jgi:hypothetical protein
VLAKVGAVTWLIYGNDLSSPKPISGEATRMLYGEYRELRPFVQAIKRAREAAGLTLAEVSRRCGIDQPALLVWRTGTTRSRRWTRSGVTLPP